MELPAGVGEEPREVMHPLEVSHSHGAPLELQRPVVALATKDAEVWGRGFVCSLPSGDVRRWVRRRRGFDSLEDRERRLALEVGPPLAAAGPEGFGEAHACERRFIGRPDLVPESRCFGEEPFPVHRVALREPHPSSSKGGAGDQRLAVESGGNELQFLRG